MLKEEIIMIGDYYDIDILVGMNVGLDILLVYIGVIIRELLEGYEKKLIYIVDLLKEWME